MKLTRCDACGTTVDSPYAGVNDSDSWFDVEGVDNDQDVQANLCSWTCLATWSMAKAMDAAPVESAAEQRVRLTDAMRTRLANMPVEGWENSPGVAHDNHKFDGACLICRGDLDAITAAAVDVALTVLAAH